MSNAPRYEIDIPAFWADPYPDLARMRREAPIAFVPQLRSTIFTRRDVEKDRGFNWSGVVVAVAVFGGLIWAILKTQSLSMAAPEIPAPSLTPNEIVPLLIGSTVGEIERELVLQTLARCDGNRTRAARVLGVSVRTLRNKIRLYSADGIDVPAHSD